MSNLRNRTSEIDGDITEILQVADMLGLNDDDFASPARFEKFKEIFNYLPKVPNKNLFIKRVTASEMNDRLQKLWEYCELAKKRDSLDARKSAIEEEKHNLKDDKKFAVFSLSGDRIESEIRDIDEEMRIYEK